MTTTSLIALFGAMMLLAAIPGPAVFAVIARSFSSGFLKGVYLIMGVTMGDYVFILLALFGLTALSEMMGATFVVIKYLSAAYLIYLGINLLRSKPEGVDIETSKNDSFLSNFTAGLLITLGNPKAILFYVGFFPAFVDVGNVVAMDILLIFAVATLAFGSVNLIYAYMAVRARKLFKTPKAAHYINKTAGTVMVSAGSIIVAKG